MKKKYPVISTVLIIVLAVALIITVYIMKNKNCESAGTQKVSQSYVKLAPVVAKASLENDKSIILLDVRTEQEYNEKHLPGSLLIPDFELAQRAEKELPDKDAVIFIYCRSGNRSRTSAIKLLEMGYTQVYDIGGINDLMD